VYFFYGTGKSIFGKERFWDCGMYLRNAERERILKLEAFSPPSRLLLPSQPTPGRLPLTAGDRSPLSAP